MRAVIQRVEMARVRSGGELVSQIARGLLVFVAVSDDDTASDVDAIAQKVLSLRLFAAEDGRLTLDVGQVGGSVMVVSNFTLAGDCWSGRRPSFRAAAPAAEARRLVSAVAEELVRAGVPTSEGAFGEHMSVESVNDGPVTVLLESKRAF